MTTPDAKYGFNDLAYGRVKAALGSSDTYFELIKGNVYPFLPGWASSKELFSTFRGPDGSLEVIKIIDIIGNRLTVERGQDGTVARNWPPGALLTQRSVGADLGKIIQKGEFREISYNPNGVLAGLYPGEKVYETGGDACQKRWWLFNAGTNWRLLAGEKCDWEFYDGDGYVRLAYLDFAGIDGYIEYQNANWTTCRTAPTGDTTYDGLPASIIRVKAEEFNQTYYKIQRAFLYFDLAGAPMGITGVDLCFWAFSGSGDPLGYVQQGTQGTPLSNVDYDAFTGPVLGSFDPETGPGYREVIMPLNYDGVYYVELIVGLGSVAKFSIREYAHDVNGLIVPDYYIYGFQIYDDTYPVENYRPFLRLRYD